MLFDLLLHHPEALGAIVRHTPTWVWGLLAALVALGASQLRARTASLARVSALPVAMTAFSAWGTFTAFGHSPIGTEVVLAWLAVAAAVAAAVGRGRAAATYDAASRTYRLPGSVVPLLLVVGVFLVKWAVGVELAMEPQAAANAAFALPVAAVYGVINGLFAGRAARLWRLALRPTPAAVPAAA